MNKNMIESKEVWYKYLKYCFSLPPTSINKSFNVIKVCYEPIYFDGIAINKSGHIIVCGFIEPDGSLNSRRFHIDEDNFKVW